MPPLQGVGVLAETFDLAGAAARVAAGTAWRSEDPDRKARRADRLCGPAADGRSAVDVEEILERVLDDPDLRPVHWLSGGLRVARSVGLVKCPPGNGTGFLVAPGTRGGPVDRNGQLVTPTTPVSLRAWTANKGSWVSALVKALRGGADGGERRTLADTVLGGP